MTLIIQGFSDGAKVPGPFGETLFAQSPFRFGGAALKVLLVGLKHASAGNIALDTEVRRLLSPEDADTACGAGGEAARMAYAAFAETLGMSGVEIYVACPSPAGGAAAATLTITVTGTASANSTFKFWVGRDLVEVNVASGTVQNDIATAIAAAFASVAGAARLPVTALAATNVVTLTVKSAGIRGNDYICYADISLAYTATVALGGAGAAVTSSSTMLGRKFGGGTGTETLTTLQTTLYPEWHEFYAVAQNDATSLASWELQCDAKAGPTEGRMEHFVVGHNGTFAAATSIAQTTLNNVRFSLKWLEISERHPSEIAACVAALRAALESTTPNKSYDKYAYRHLHGQRFPVDWVTSYVEKQAALDVGVSPLRSASDGKVYEVRSITTRCLNGSTPDYRTLDTAESYVPDYTRRRLCDVWENEFVVANPYVRPDPTDNEPPVKAGVATPSNWKSRVTRELQVMEGENILAQVALNPPSAEFNYVAKRIMLATMAIPLPAQHQVGISVRQGSVSAP